MQRIYINDDWRFTSKFNEALLDDTYEVANLAQVRLPHACQELPFHYFDELEYQMVSGYRKLLNVPSEWQGKRVFLTFEGVAHVCEVFLNGEKIGEHRCGYTAFTIEISQQLRYGEDNLLVVKVDSRECVNVPPFGHVIDYMTYGGIYRDVYVDVKEVDYIEDAFIRSELRDLADTPNAKMLSEVNCHIESDGEYQLQQSIRKKGEATYQLLGTQKARGGLNLLAFEVPNIALWNTENPNLYEIKTELLKLGRKQGEKAESQDDEKENVTDIHNIFFGFRKIEFKADGFYLNDKKLRLRGLNRHQSYPYVGYAMPESMQKLDADYLKYELGVNAVRTSHYPQSHYFLDRCDELGLLVFTEIPGWQHIGNDEWKNQAVENTKDMVRQYRNHTSIFIWGVRINESVDNDALYERTNAAAHELDPSRPTGGVRALKKGNLLEDVYTYNDFVHEGVNKGCEPKKNVTPDMSKAYFVSEFNGHMFPTKTYDCEEHRTEHALRHAAVLDAVAGEEDIAGCFGWCMFDYNTHKDFGSGDRICYHGVMDMFRNHKQAAAIYACQQKEQVVLEVSSSMDIGEHPASMRGNIYIYSNADSVRMYKNDRLLKEYYPKDSEYKNLENGPIVVDDFIGDALEVFEHFPKNKAEDCKKVLNAYSRYGFAKMPKSIYLIAAKLILRYGMSMSQAMDLYTRYVGNWGQTATSYRFEAMKDGKVVKTIVKEPMTSRKLDVWVDHTDMQEKNTYDVSAVRIRMLDEHSNLLNFYQGIVNLRVEGDIELIGPSAIALQGGMSGTYVKSTKAKGQGKLILEAAGLPKQEIKFTIGAENA